MIAGMEKKKTSEELLQDHLGIVGAMLSQCAQEAKPDPDDEFGARRSGELVNAAMLLKASARLGFALAKLKGEFQHNIRVDRDTPSKS